MRLTRISIANHSRLADADLEVRQHLVLVGPNDVGKSSLLRCLDLLLGTSTAQLYQRIAPEDFRDAEQPLLIQAALADFATQDEALFPDEITVDPTSGAKSLAVRLSATLDGADTISIERIAPGAGTGRQLSREQVAGLGWTFLGALGATRDLRDDQRSHLQQILQGIDLGAERADFDALVEQLQGKLDSSSVLGGLRSNLATQLSLVRHCRKNSPPTTSSSDRVRPQRTTYLPMSVSKSRRTANRASSRSNQMACALSTPWRSTTS